MLGSLFVLLIALTGSSIASALPPLALEEADAAVPVAPTSTGYIPSTTADLFVLPVLDSRDKDGGRAAETAHTEETAVLAVPTFGDSKTSTYYTPFQALATPTSPSRIGPKPQLPHVESTQSELMAPTPQVTSTRNEVVQPPVKATPQIVNTPTTAAAPESPTYNAPAPTTQDNKAYDNSSPNSAVPNVPANSAPAPTAGPSPMSSSGSGALGLVAGSTGVVVNGLTVSISNAPSSSPPSTGTALKSVLATSKAGLAPSQTSSSGPQATGAAASTSLVHTSFFIGLGIALAGILA